MFSIIRSISGVLLSPLKWSLGNFPSFLACATFIMTANVAFPSFWAIVENMLFIQYLNFIPPVKKITLNKGLSGALSPMIETGGALVMIRNGIKVLNPDFWRTIMFWQRLIPIYTRYMVTKFSARNLPAKERNEIWANRHEWGGKKVHKLVVEMSGYYIKSAQVFATKTDFMPEPWTRRLSTLFDTVPPRPFSEISENIEEQIRETSFGISFRSTHNSYPTLSHVFSHIDKESLASASIAQVHSGQLLNGTPVVIKIQHKGMSTKMASDLRNIGRVASFLKNQLPFDLENIVKEIQATIPLEFDFTREVFSLNKVRENLRSRHQSEITCPKTYSQFCSHQMIVMERLNGVPFSQILAMGAPQVIPAAQAAFQKLLKAFGQMIFLDGVFHADPHPGNLLLLPNAGLGLVDFGQCKQLSIATRVQISTLILALANKDHIAIASALESTGIKFGFEEALANGSSLVSNGSQLNGAVKDGNGGSSVEVAVRLAYVLFDTRNVPDANISPWATGSILQKNPLTTFNQSMWLICRCILLLRGVCHSLGMDVSTAVIWRPYAAQFLESSAVTGRC